MSNKTNDLILEEFREWLEFHDSTTENIKDGKLNTLDGGWIDVPEDFKELL